MGLDDAEAGLTQPLAHRLGEVARACQDAFLCLRSSDLVLNWIQGQDLYHRRRTCILMLLRLPHLDCGLCCSHFNPLFEKKTKQPASAMKEPGNTAVAISSARPAVANPTAIMRHLRMQHGSASPKYEGCQAILVRTLHVLCSGVLLCLDRKCFPQTKEKIY